MTLPIVLRQEARAEFDEAFDWYEQQQVGLGVEFAERVQAVFDRISPMPELHAIVHKVPARGPSRSGDSRRRLSQENPGKAVGM